MDVKIFDDFLSFVHVLAGFVTIFYPIIFIVFIIYEFLELAIKNEPVEHYIGDFIEFFIGLSIAWLIFVYKI